MLTTSKHISLSVVWTRWRNVWRISTCNSEIKFQQSLVDSFILQHTIIKYLIVVNPETSDDAIEADWSLETIKTTPVHD